MGNWGKRDAETQGPEDTEKGDICFLASFSLSVIASS